MGKEILRLSSSPKSTHITAVLSWTAHCTSQADSNLFIAGHKNRSYLGFIINCHHKWQNMKSKMEHSPSYRNAVGRAPKSDGAGRGYREKLQNAVRIWSVVKVLRRMSGAVKS
jgi:hypothetical protein